jgi:hypothetical protein
MQQFSVGQFAPEPFEIVKLAGFLLHDMDNHVAEVKKDPLVGLSTFDAERYETFCF